MNTMSHEQVLRLFHYDPDSGDFYKKSNGSRGHIKANGYRRISVSKKTYSVQRLIWIYMTGEEPTGDVDHIDHDRINNRWDNLRQVTRQQNMQNSSKSRANSSGHTGVYWSKPHRAWRAQIVVDGKCRVLGRFESLDDAVQARQAANEKYRFHQNHGAVHAHVQSS